LEIAGNRAYDLSILAAELASPSQSIVSYRKTVPKVARVHLSTWIAHLMKIIRPHLAQMRIIMLLTAPPLVVKIKTCVPDVSRLGPLIEGFSAKASDLAEMKSLSVV
jgi:hypothetical protein